MTITINNLKSSLKMAIVASIVLHTVVLYSMYATAFNAYQNSQYDVAVATRGLDTRVTYTMWVGARRGAW